MPRVKKTTQSTKTKKPASAAGEQSMSVPVFSLEGKETKKLSVSSSIFGAKVHKSLLVQYMRMYQTNQRQGNASAKTRSEVAGSTKKIYRQKGTGRARHGANTAPIFVGGGVSGGPKPKDFELKMNKKQKRIALYSALSLQLKENNILGIGQSVTGCTPKTKPFVRMLRSMNVFGKRLLMVLPKIEKNNLILAARNVKGTEFIEAKNINPYAILRAQKVIFTEKALEFVNTYFLPHAN